MKEEIRAAAQIGVMGSNTENKQETKTISQEIDPNPWLDQIHDTFFFLEFTPNLLATHPIYAICTTMLEVGGGSVHHWLVGMT